MMQYIEGDLRFKKVKHEKYSIVKAWTQKEFKNLELARKAGVRVPLPIIFKNNVLVMEFIGKNGKAALTLKEKPVENPATACETILKAIADMLYKSRFIHADLSEYNILNNGEELVLIDAGQGVLTSHPHAKEFFERDVQNVARYFQKQGVAITVEEAFERIRKFKPKTTGKKY
jgi:RIO kinase 1